MTNIIDRKAALIVDRLHAVKSEDTEEIRRVLYDTIGELSLDGEVQNNLNIVDILVGALVQMIAERARANLSQGRIAAE